MSDVSPPRAPDRVRAPSLVDAYIPVAALIVLLATSYLLFGDKAASGPNQVALVFCSLIASGIAVKNGLPWSGLRQAMIQFVQFRSERIRSSWLGRSDMRDGIDYLSRTDALTSARPKVDAACRFAEMTGRQAGIGALKDLSSILRREAGTTISTVASGVEWAARR